MKKVLRCLLLIMVIVSATLILSACGGDGDKFVPYIEFVHNLDYELDINEETKTITYTTKGPDAPAVQFNDEDFKFVYHKSETEQITLERWWGPHDELTENQYDIDISWSRDFNRPGEYEVSLYTKKFGKQTYNIICNKITIEMPTYRYSNGANGDTRPGFNYTGDYLDATKHINFHGYKSVWSTDSPINKTTGEIGLSRLAVGNYKAYFYLNEDAQAFYQTKTGETETYVDWIIKRKAISAPVVGWRTFDGERHAPEVENDESYDDPSLFVYINTRLASGDEVFSKVRDAGDYMSTFSFGANKDKYCFLEKDAQGNDIEKDTVESPWTITKREIHIQYIRVHGTPASTLYGSSSATYTGSTKGVNIYYTEEHVTDYKKAVKYEQSSSNPIQFKFGGDVTKTDAGEYCIEVSPADDNIIIERFDEEYYCGGEPLKIDWKITKQPISAPVVYDNDGVSIYENDAHITYSGKADFPKLKIIGKSGVGFDFSYGDNIKASETPYTFDVIISESSAKNYCWAQGELEKTQGYSYYIDRKEVDVDRFLSWVEPTTAHEQFFEYPTTKLEEYKTYSGDLLTFEYENNVQDKVGDYKVKVKPKYLHDDKESLILYKYSDDGTWTKVETSLEEEYEINFKIKKNTIFKNDNYIIKHGAWEKTYLRNDLGYDEHKIYSIFRLNPIIGGKKYVSSDTANKHLAIVYDLFNNKTGEFLPTTDLSLTDSDYKIVAKELRYYYSETEYINPYENENFDVMNIIGREAVYNWSKTAIHENISHFIYSGSDHYIEVDGKKVSKLYSSLSYDDKYVYAVGELPETYIILRKFLEGYAVTTLYEGDDITSEIKVNINYTYYDENMKELDSAPYYPGKYYQKVDFSCDDENYFFINNEGNLIEFIIAKIPVELPDLANFTWEKEFVWSEELDIKSSLNLVNTKEDESYLKLVDVQLDSNPTSAGANFAIPVFEVKDEYKDICCFGELPRNYYFKYTVNKIQINPSDVAHLNEYTQTEFEYTGEPLDIEKYFGLTITKPEMCDGYQIKIYKSGYTNYTGDVLGVGSYQIAFIIKLNDEYRPHYEFTTGETSAKFPIIVSILPKQLTEADVIIDSPATITYDGETHTPLVKFGDIVLDAVFEITDQEGNVVEEAKDVGLYTFTLQEIVGNYQLTGEFNISTTIKIEYKVYDLSTFVWSNSQLSYNGQAQSVAIVSETDIEFDYSNNSFTDAGIYTATATVKEEFLNNTNLTFIGEIPSCEWEIKKQDVDISTLSWNYTEAFVYDGNKKSVEVVQNYGLEFAYSNAEGTDAGTYTAMATLASTENANKNYNYVGETVSLSWTINPQVVNLNECEWDYTEAFVYDSTAKTVLMKGDYTFTYQNNLFTDAGSYSATATVVDDRIGNPNYTIIGKTSYTLEWEIAKFVIKVEDIEFNYARQPFNEHMLVQVTYSGNEFEVLPTNLPEFATYTISGNVATLPGAHSMRVESTNANVLFEKSGTSKTYFTEVWHIHKVIIDASGIKLKQYMVEDSDVTQCNGIDMSTVPEGVEVEAVSTGECSGCGNYAFIFYIRATEPSLYQVKYKDQISTTSDGLRVVDYFTVYPAEEDVHYAWSDLYYDDENQKYYITYDPAGIDLYLYGNIEYVADWTITFTDKDGIVYNEKERPILKVGETYTVHTELGLKVDMDFEIPDVEAEVYPRHFSGEYLKFMYRTADGTEGDAEEINYFNYTGEAIEFYLDTYYDIAVEIEYTSENKLTLPGEYYVHANVTVVDPNFISETLSYSYYVVIRDNPIQEIKHINLNGEKYNLSYDDTGLSVSEIYVGEKITFKLNKGYQIYVNGEAAPQSEDGLYYCQSDSDFTITIKRGDVEVETFEVTVTSSSGGSVVFPGFGI